MYEQPSGRGCEDIMPHTFVHTSMINIDLSLVASGIFVNDIKTQRPSKIFKEDNSVPAL